MSERRLHVLRLPLSRTCWRWMNSPICRAPSTSIPIGAAVCRPATFSPCPGARIGWRGSSARGKADGGAPRGYPHRGIRLALSAMARRVLPPGSAAEGRTCLRLKGFPHHRDQWHVLFAAALSQFSRLGRDRTRGFHLCGEGPALHHAHAAAEERKGPAGEFFRFRRAPAGCKAWTRAVAI